MPELERYRNFDAATNQTRAVRVATPTGEGVDATLRAVDEINTRIMQARAAREVAHAEVEATRQYDKVFRELEADGEGDYDEFENRLKEGSQKIKENLSGGLKSSAARQIMEQRLQTLETSYVLRTRDLTRRRAVEDFGAGVVGMVDSLAQTADDVGVPMTGDMSSRSFSNEKKALEALITSGQRNGMLGADDVAQYEVKIGALERDAISKRHVSNIDTLMDAGRYGEAEALLKSNWNEIDPTLRERIEIAIDAKAEDAQAYADADAIWTHTDGDYGAAMEQVRAIDNPDRRKAVTGLINARKAQEDAAQRERDTELASDAWSYLANGGSIARMNAEQWRNLDGETQRAMRDWERIRANASKAPDRETDLAAYDALHSRLEGGDPLSALNYLNSNYDRFSVGDYKTLRAKVSNAIDDPQATVESVRSVTQVVTNSIERAGLKDDVRGELLRAYDLAAQEYQAENGAEPSDQWRDERIESLAAEFKIRKPGLFNDRTSAAYEVESIGTVPQEHTQAVLNAFGRVDDRTVISEEKLNRAYSMAMAYFRMNGIQNPSDEAITSMIKAQQGSDE